MGYLGLNFGDDPIPFFVAFTARLWETEMSFFSDRADSYYEAGALCVAPRACVHVQIRI